jgi:hypothetical protein
MPRATAAGTIWPRMEDLRQVIELHDAPKAPRLFAESLGVLLFVDGDFRLNVHDFASHSNLEIFSMCSMWSL